MPTDHGLVSLAAEKLRYSAPAWLPGGHAQTIWAALGARRTEGPIPAWSRERWTTPDADFIEADWVGRNTSGTLLALFHGLEGSSRSHYAQAFAEHALQRGWACVVPHFRGCGGTLNLAPRAYHSGDHEEVDWMLRRVRSQHKGPIVAVGISLGGNALLRWAQEAGSAASSVVTALAAICAPIDLNASGRAIDRGFNRQVYARMFLRSMKPRALAKWAQFPGLFDRETLIRANDLYSFDNVFTAPLHGFRNTEDYWSRASSKPHLHRLRVPSLVVNARNDPFVPASCLPHQSAVGEYAHLWQPLHGGHVGFPAGSFPGTVKALPDQVGAWLALQL